MKPCPAADRIELQEGTDSRGNQGGLDEQDPVGWCRPAAPATMIAGVTQRQSWRDVLQGQGQGFKEMRMPSMEKSEALRLFEIGSFSTMMRLL